MSKKIIFMGTPQFSVKTLKVLVDSNHEIKCIYTQPPKKSSRGQKIHISPIQKIAEKLNLKVRTPSNLESDVEYEFFKSLNPYLVIVVAYGQIIPEKYLTIPIKGFLNIHASLLPRWRGAAPIQRAIMNNDNETGISFMKINKDLDSGPYMKQLKIKIDKQSTTQKISDELSELGAKNILECIELIEKDEAEFVNQNENKSTYAKKIKKIESKIIWTETASEILAKINSLNPSPGAWFKYNGSRYKVWKAEISSLNGLPGEIIGENFTIGCKEDSIKILELQKEGKNKLKTKDFLIGNKILKGEKLF